MTIFVEKPGEMTNWTGQSYIFDVVSDEIVSRIYLGFVKNSPEENSEKFEAQENDFDSDFKQ